MKPEKLRNKIEEIRQSIVSLIFNLIRTCPNWYLQIQDVDGNLIYSRNEEEVILSVTVKDFGNDGEKPVVWIGTFEEERYIKVENLDLDLMVNVYEAMLKELE